MKHLRIFIYTFSEHKKLRRERLTLLLEWLRIVHSTPCILEFSSFSTHQGRQFRPSNFNTHAQLLFPNLFWSAAISSLFKTIGSLISKCAKRNRAKFEEVMTGADSTETRRKDDFTLGVVEGKDSEEAQDVLCRTCQNGDRKKMHAQSL